MTKPRILLDCDGILSDFHTPCLAIINELTGKDHKLEDIHSWDIFEALGVSADIRKATYDRMNTPGWCSKLKPYPGAAQGVAKLREMGEIHIVTSPMRGDTWHRERELWIWKHFEIGPKYVTHTASKNIVHGDVLIDDRDDNLLAWREEHVNRYGLAVKWVTYPSQPNNYLGHYFWDWDLMLEFLNERFIEIGGGE